MVSRVWLILFGLFSWLCSPVVGGERPNILLVVSEDNGPQLGCYNDPYAKTPNLDALASQGIRFERAFVPQAGCSQSRASLLTGRYPHEHGQIGLATWGYRMVREDMPNLPRSLKEGGYRTGIIGKLHINPESAFPFDFRAIENGNFARKNLGDYSKFAKEFIESGEEPFFLSVNYPDAHDTWLRQVGGLPANPQTGDEVQAMPAMGIDPAGMREMVADYYNCISRLDSLVGDLLGVLEASGKASNTIVIYLGDHGADMLRGKRTSYEGGLRIPLLLRWPGRVHPQVRSELVSTIDLFPTLLQAAELQPPVGLPGMAMQPLFAPSEPNWRTELFAEYHTHAGALNYFPQRSVRNERYKLIENLLPGEVHPDYDNTFSKLSKEAKRRKIPGGLDLHAVISRADPIVREAYQLMRQPPRFELYDLEKDPFEFRNLAGTPEHLAIEQQLRSTLDVWRKESKDPLLDSKVLQRLSEEVRSLRTKEDAKDHEWKYPEYFSGGSYTEVILFEENTDGFKLYRIPGVVVTSNGTILAYCEARKYTDADRGEIEIHLRRSTDGGVTWSKANQVAHHGTRSARNPYMSDKKKSKNMGGPDEQTVNNPVAICSRNGTVYLLYCVEYMRCFLIRSEDHGESWSEPTEITSAIEQARGILNWQVVATGPGHGIETRSGRLMVPIWMTDYEKRTEISKSAGVLWSDDGGESWQVNPLVIPRGGESNIVQRADGSVLMTSRNTLEGDRRLGSISVDGGNSWSPPEFFEDLLEPGCMAGLVMAPGVAGQESSKLLYSAPYTVERAHQARKDLTLYLSEDSGKTWSIRKRLHDGPSAYSDLAVLPSGEILCFYEKGVPARYGDSGRPWAYRYLAIAKFPLSWVFEGAE
jgi:N-sulfoglucosamine sulfohydrolase